ncbi:MAG: TIGR02147 family protein [Oligoflexales bacterium]
MEPTDADDRGIYKFTNYRDYLQASLTKLKEDGLSFRALAKKAELGSPSYFQAILSGKKNITVKTATKIADALDLKGNQRKYFLDLVNLDLCDPAEKAGIYEDMRRCMKRDLYNDVVDADIFFHWLNIVIRELATTDCILNVDSICEKLGNLAKRSEVEKSLDFLVKRKWLIPTGEEGRYSQAAVKLAVLNDMRSIDIQRSHLNYLDIAKHRINDDLDEREYQGLTISVPETLLPEIKTRIRDFMQEMRDFLRNRDNCDAVIRVQCMAFKVTKD